MRSVSGQPHRLCDAPADDGAAGDKEIENDLYFVFTAQEEVGLRRRRRGAFAVEPDAAIAVDGDRYRATCRR